MNDKQRSALRKAARHLPKQDIAEREARAKSFSKSEFVKRLAESGWLKVEAQKQYHQMLRDAAEEDGMD